MLETLERAGRMNACDEAAEPAQRLGIFELRCPTRTARIEREAKTVVLRERLAGTAKRRDDRDFACGELERKSVLFLQSFVRPSPRTIELRDDRRAVVDPDLIDAILEAVQREES